MRMCETTHCAGAMRAEWLQWLLIRDGHTWGVQIYTSIILPAPPSAVTHTTPPSFVPLLIYFLVDHNASNKSERYDTLLQQSKRTLAPSLAPSLDWIESVASSLSFSSKHRIFSDFGVTVKWIMQTHARCSARAIPLSTTSFQTLLFQIINYFKYHCFC